AQPLADLCHEVVRQGDLAPDPARTVSERSRTDYERRVLPGSSASRGMVTLTMPLGSLTEPWMIVADETGGDAAEMRLSDESSRGRPDLLAAYFSALRIACAVCQRRRGSNAS